MYSKSNSTIGNFEILEINNQDNSHKLSIIPQKGLLITDLKLKNIHVIDGVETGEELENNSLFKSSWLAPFPNRIKDGTYKYGNHNYQLSINEKPRNNALHGFIYDKPFELVDENYEEAYAALTFRFSYNGEIKGYPFPFDTEIVLKLSDSNGLEISMNFENRSGKSIPFGFGWHPYFKLSGNADQLSLQLPEVKMYEVDEQMIPTGNIKDYNDFNDLKIVGDTNLDTCFKLTSDKGTVETIIKDTENNTLKIWQETGANKFNFLQCFIPPHRRSIAVEPVSSCINAFNNEIGLLKLAPGEKVSAKVGILVN